jgi:hypothetical protein
VAPDIIIALRNAVPGRVRPLTLATIFLLAIVSACENQTQNSRASATLSAIEARWQAEDAVKRSDVASRHMVKNVPPDLKRFATATVAAMLKDPESARYRFDFLSIGANSEAVCGAVNAKNSYGGYVGMQRFYVEFVNERVAESRLQGTRNRLVNLCGFSANDESRSESEPQ